MNLGITTGITKALNIIVSGYYLIIGLDGYMGAVETIKKTRESVNVQLSAQELLGDYVSSYSGTMESIRMAKRLDVLNELLPEPPEVKLVFTDQNGNFIEFNQSVCKNDLLTIDYEFGKFNSTGNFESKLEITAPSGTKTLVFNNLSGSYGPIAVKDLFNIADPPNPTPSGDCSFALPGGDILYTIYYDSAC
jgi:hypothetical protein